MAVPDARVEFLLGGSWTSAIDEVLNSHAIRYSWGRRAEGARTDSAAASFVLKNSTGKWSASNPTGPYYGQLGRNTPTRLSHGGANVALVVPGGTLSNATTPDVAALDIVGDIDVRADLTPAAWGGTTSTGYWEVMGKYALLGGNRSWAVLIIDDGTIEFRWSENGVLALVQVSTVPVPFAPGERGAIRATLDVNNGSGGHVVTFYTASSMAGSWTQLGDAVVGVGTTSIFNSTASLEVGDITSVTSTDIAREYHAIEVRNGIGGSAVANPDFTAQASGTTSFADAAGRTWTAASGLITSRRVRAQLEATEAWVPRWTNAYNVTAPVTASGILHRLGQGQKPLESTLRRGLPNVGDGPVAYWPMEDGSQATQAASAVVGVPALRISGFDFAADDSCPGASTLPTIGAAATMHAAIPPYTSSTAGYTVAMMYSLDALPASKSAFLSLQATGTIRGVVISHTATDMVCDLYGAGGVLLTSQTMASASFGEGRWWRFNITAQQNGGNTDFQVGYVADDGTSELMVFSTAGSPGLISDVDTGFGALLDGMAIGHLVIYADSVSYLWNDAEIGYRGEEAGARLLRLCGEEGIPVTIADGPVVHTRMGPQRPATLLDLLDEVATADGGILFEDRDQTGLVYRTRASLYSQTPKATIPYDQLAPPLEPTGGDRYVRNDRTVVRTRGSSARAVLTSGALSTAAPPDGAGLYDDSTTVNVETDDQLPDIAAWLLHRGTWNEDRYPQLRILLHKYPALVPAVSALQPGDVIRITGLPSWLGPGPVDLMVEGGTEDFQTLAWTVTLSCSPAGPWNVAVLGDATYGRSDTAGSTLAAGVTSSATSLSVATPSGPLWATSGETPFDVEVGGEVMTVTAVSGASSPQTFTVTRSVNGVVKAHASAAAVALAQPMILAL